MSFDFRSLLHAQPPLRHALLPLRQSATPHSGSREAERPESGAKRALMAAFGMSAVSQKATFGSREIPGAWAGNIGLVA
jgi:hypothetical protein